MKIGQINFHDEFKKFKELFNFFLNKRNNINSMDEFNHIPIRYLFSINKKKIPWKLLNYLLEKGSDLNFLLNGTTILLTFCESKEYIDAIKYIIIRSFEINNDANTQVLIDKKDNHDKDEDGEENDLPLEK